MPNAIFTDRPFHYSCMEGDKEVKREISTKAKVAIIAIAILASPFVLFFGAVPLFFLACAWYKSRQPGFVRPPRAEPIRVDFNRQNERSRGGNFARGVRSVFGSVFSAVLTTDRSSAYARRSREPYRSTYGHIPAGSRTAARDSAGRSARQTGFQGGFAREYEVREEERSTYPGERARVGVDVSRGDQRGLNARARARPEGGNVGGRGGVGQRGPRS
ncbi:hypothetical protein [Parachlamydia acanthamoebae]|uniref:hypothetical protein n=1 Tax=Parachlamydia acanthamoebae TaxID=83552 RepID=UPI00075077A1|nr:hypothetical protein [Parachlamydia acanthamoebae]